MRPLVTAIVSASLVCAASTAARAAPPDDIEVALTPGVLTRPAGNSGSPVALGFGARAGAMISGFYFGLGVVNYWGGSQSEGPPPNAAGLGASTSPASVGAEYLLYGLDLGYSFALLDRFLVRPQLGVGLDNTTSTCAVLGSGTSYTCSGLETHSPYLEPGVTGLLPLGRMLFAGVDANLLLLIGSRTVAPALTMHFQLGLRF